MMSLVASKLVTPVDLSPARWIWMPSQRTLPNTVVLLRKTITLDAAPTQALGHIVADSRYRLWVNGQRVQWGPTPCDPRELEADPVDLLPYLQQGDNVIGVEVLFYGHGDGTWPGGKPGLLANFDIQTAGSNQTIVTDDSWRCCIDRARQPGMHKRWFLRSLQEVFDARQHLWGWNEVGFDDSTAPWTTPMLLECPADKPAVCSDYEGNDLIECVQPEDAALVERTVPIMTERFVDFLGPIDTGRVEWHHDPSDWFDMRVPGAMDVIPDASVYDAEAQTLSPPTDGQGHYATYHLQDQLVGFPLVEVEAPAGTVIDIMMQESHDPVDGPKWIDSSHYIWIRLTCKQGVTRFESIDFESVRWLQLHVRSGCAGSVKVHRVALRQREYDWPNPAVMQTDEPGMQRLFDAALNTLVNSGQETVVDGMGRERQPYSGDGAQQLHAVRYAHGADALSRRFIRTFGQGMTKEGYFLDCWPAFDRMARLMQRQIDATSWGPLLDHGVGFVGDCWYHYMQTGDRALLDAAYPTLKRFGAYLDSIRTDDGLVPVEGVGLPSVWIDHFCFPEQRHKRCAFNLYIASMFRHNLARIAETVGEGADVAGYEQLSDAILQATIDTYWSDERGIFVNNLPWWQEEGIQRSCDRSLATAVLFDQCPDGRIEAARDALVDRPDFLGRSYPANACWRYWALGKLGRGDVIVNEFRNEWAHMPSVIENNTIAENWGDLALPDGGFQWSHCAVSPVFITFMELAGIHATSPGFATVDIRPQLGDLPNLNLAAYTPHGPIRFNAIANDTGHRVSLEIPTAIQATLLLPDGDALREQSLDSPTTTFDLPRQ